MSYIDGTFPDMDISSKEKDEEWHKKFATSILNQAVDSNYDLSYRMMQESYNYYDGTQESGEFSFLQETEGGDSLPAQWINYQSIRPKVAALIGEFETTSLTEGPSVPVASPFKVTVPVPTAVYTQV